jgi:hypothetical protein
MTPAKAREKNRMGKMETMKIEEPLRSTPFQTADARHNLAAAFRLCRDYEF